GYIYNWIAADLWVAANAYSLGQAIQDTNGNIQVVTTAGTSGTPNQPVWAIPSSANANPTTPDGTGSLVWTCQGPSSGLVQIVEQNGTTGPLVELAQGATIPAGVSGDTIALQIEYIKG